MDWEGREESGNVEDRRGIGKTGLAIGGGAGLLVAIVALFLGVDPQKLAGLIGNGPADGGDQQQQAPADPAEERQAHFSKVIFGDTERVWEPLFRDMGKQYKKPTLVLYTGQVETACGQGEAAVGPFYCGGDSKVYIDLSFYREMEKKLGAPGDFARAYVIAHEVGHHVQRLLGYADPVDRARRTQSKTEANQMSVRLELQADFLAGVWAYHGQKQFNFLKPGDIESALNAAHQIGDDYLQKRTTGRIVPDSFTHGTSQHAHALVQGRVSHRRCWGSEEAIRPPLQRTMSGTSRPG